MKRTQPGFFTMDFIRGVSEITDLQVAKTKCLDRIDQMPTAKPENSQKAKAMVLNSKSVRQLILGLANFVLAHEDDKLKVIH
jgi:hypothetical protein